MSDPHDHDAGPDPIDAAYDRAEALLDDEAARAARRARVLAAVAQDAAPAQAPARREARAWGRRAWGRGGWLVAAGVAALGLFLAVQTYRPPIVEPPPPGPTVRPGASSAPSPSTASQPAPQRPAAADALAAKSPAAQAAAPPADQPAASKREELASPSRAAAAAPQSASQSASRGASQTSEMVVTAERRTQSLERVPVEVSPAPPPPPPPPPPPAAPPEAIATPRPAPPASQNSTVSVSAFTSRARDEAAPRGGLAAKAAPPASVTGAPDPAARLRAAAAAGRTAELAKLLGQGVPVDSPGDDGDTALIESVRADHPAAAALLRRHGASPDRRNEAGESARDIARAKADPDLNRALGVAP